MSCPVVDRSDIPVCADEGGRCYAWDVVNEVLADDGTLRSSPWFDTIGEDYIRIAFETAAAVAKAANDPVKLYYNDFGIEFPGVKSDAAQKRESMPCLKQRPWAVSRPANMAT